MSITRIDGGVTAPKGFTAAGVAAGIKSGGKLDVSLLVSQVRCAAAAVFTTNQLKGASLLVGREHLEDRHAQAVIVNSGNANACTGERGLLDAQEMCRTLARLMNIPVTDIIPCSTGVIGIFLPLANVRKGIETAFDQLSKEGHKAMAEAILTTDLVPKESAYKIVAEGCEVHLGGCAKGSGMIHPNMATMFCFLTTDARIAPETLDTWLRDAVNQSFNRITVDGDTSCCDTVLILANGLGSGREIGDDDSDLCVQFKKALRHITWDLARAIACDGEGVQRTCLIKVRGTKSNEDATTIARAIAQSPLYKTAMAGGDPNWGRIINAAGYSGVQFDPNQVDLWIGDIKVMDRGMRATYEEADAAAVFSKKEFEVSLDLHQGTGESWYYTTDLTQGYIDINADYRHRT